MEQYFIGNAYANFFREHDMWGYNSRAGFHAGNDFNFALGLSAIFVDIHVKSAGSLLDRHFGILMGCQQINFQEAI